MKNKFCLAVLIQLFVSVLVHAGYVKHYTINEGLANNAIYSITQDSKGLMWLGSIDGLHSFDGNHIRVWRNDSIQTLGPIIFTIQEDTNGYLWLGTDKGLAILNLRTEKFVSSKVLKENGLDIWSFVTKIYMDSKKNLWIATLGQGIFHFDIKSKKLKQYSGVARTFSDYIQNIMEDHEGTVWAVSNREGIASLNTSNDTFERRTSGEFQDNMVMFEDSHNNLWVGNSEKGLLLFDRESNQLHQKVAPFDKKRPLMVRSIVEWEPGVLYFASDEGLTSYSVETGEYRRWGMDTQGERLNDNYLHSLFIDREGALWIGSYFGGVNYISPINTNFKHYHAGNSDFDARIISVFAQAEEDNLWIGTDDVGFFYWNRQKNTFKAYRPSSQEETPTYHNIHAILQDDDRLWVGMYLGGLDLLDLKTGKVRNFKTTGSPHSLYSNDIYAIYRDMNGKIWIGTTGGLNRYNEERNDFDRIYELAHADVSNIMEDKNGNLWVCSHNLGIFCLNREKGKWEHFCWKADAEEYSTPSNKIETMAHDRYGTIWVGTNGNGLLKLLPDEHKFVKEVLPEEVRVIQKIIAYGDGLWMSTSNGLYEYVLGEGVLRVYNKYDGLQENHFLPNSGIQLSDGTILFGGINGFNEFHPNRIVYNNHKPTVILTDFHLFNKPVTVDSEDAPLKVSITYADKLELTHKQSTFGFSVAALSYMNTSKFMYRYKMEGLDRDWIETRQFPRVTYTRIPSGNYTFLVSVSNGNGIWYKDVIALPIHIKSPWWASRIAVVIYILTGIGLFIYLFHWINLRHRKKLNRFAQEKDKEIYKSKMEFFTLMIHEIRTPLTLILAPLGNVMKSKATVEEVMPQLQIIERNGKRLLSLVNQLMDYRKVEEGGMTIHPVEVDIKLIVTNICLRFAPLAQMKKIQLVVNTPDEGCHVRVDEEAFNKVVSNLLSNALKFTATHIWVNLYRTSNHSICLSVRDNGIGISVEEQEKIFQPFFQSRVKRNADNVGTGVGLLLVKKMVDLMEGSLKLESEIGVGSTFSIFFKECDMCALPQGAVKQEETDNAEMPENEEVLTDKDHLILVVDDNKDMLEYLSFMLKDLYQVVCASNGEQALGILQEQPVDLVITDVMMPVMDGVEFCRRIKTNLQFSHIPVILLTAMVSVENKLEGLENGADLYIEKPFSTEIMKAHIANLFKNRERLNGEFQKDMKLSPSVDSLSKLDVEFFHKVSELILAHLSDTNFNVEVLAKEVGISRSGLFAKMKIVSGMTPNDYIRLVRLKRASELLLKHDVSQISEICFEVGFSSPSYFTKCFQNQFGLSPTEFRKKYV